MVNAQKHQKLISDWPTRARKKIIRQQLRSNNAKKMEKTGNKLLWNRGGVAGRRSIVETEQKRQQANNEFMEAILGKKDGA